MIRNVYPWALVSTLFGFGIGLTAVAVASLPPAQVPLVVAAILLPFTIGLAARAERVLLVVLLFETAIPLDVFLGFREDAAELSALPGLPLSVTTILLGLLYAVWVLRRLAALAPADRGLLEAVAPLAAYVAVVALSATWAVDAQLAGFEIGFLIQMLLLFVYLVHAIRTPADLAFVVRVLVFVLFVQGLIMTGLVVTGRSIEWGPFLARIDMGIYPRVAGTVGSPNAAGAFLTLLLVPTAASWRSASSLAWRAFALVTFLLGVAMLILTLSRGGWLGFSLAMAIFLFVGVRRRWLSSAFVLGVAIVAVGLVVAFAQPIEARLFGPGASTAEDRLGLMRLAFDMVRDRPWTGVGANGFSAALPDYVTPDFAGSFISIVHNKYLIVLSETGAIGLLAFLAFVGATLRRGWTATARLATPSAILALGLTAAFSGVLLHMFFDLFHGRTDTQILIVIAALITAAWRVAQRSDPGARRG